MSLAVFGLTGTTITNTNVDIFGNEAVYSGGSISNASASIVHGTVYEYSYGQVTGSTGSSYITGGIIRDPTDLATYNTAVLNDASVAASYTQTQTFSTINSATTVHGNGRLNVIDINGDIRNSLILSGTTADIFVVNVSGVLTLSGTATLGLSGGVTANHVLYNFTSSGQNLTTQANNVMNGTILAANDTFNSVEGILNGEIIAKGSIKLLLNAQVTAAGFDYSDGIATPEASSVTMVLFGLAGLMTVRSLRCRARDGRSSKSRV
jgi:choice-of-anchor A domain-containing protein